MEERVEILVKYLDTSIIVSLLAFEETTPSAVGWLGQQPAGSLASSLWLEAELSSALARKLRTGRLTAAEREQCQLRFRTDVVPALLMVDIDRESFELTAAICDRHEAGIRSGDALHLAIAAGHGMTLCTFDRVLAKGAAQLGYAVELIA